MTRAEQSRMAKCWRSVERLWVTAAIAERIKPTRGAKYTSGDLFELGYLAGQRAMFLDSFAEDK